METQTPTQTQTQTQLQAKRRPYTRLEHFPEAL